MSMLSGWGKLSSLACAGAMVVLGAPLFADPAERVVSVGGSLTEIVYALGQEHRLVARDVTSNYPKEALDLPDVGYVRRLSPEGLLSVDPDLILVEEGAGPPEALELLNETQIPVVTVPMGFDREAVLVKISTVAQALGVSEAGAELSARIAGEIDQATQAELTGQKVLFVLTIQGGRILAGGTNTAADGVITLAGAQNAVQGYEGYKLLNDEAVLTPDPDVILMMDSRLNEELGDDVLLSHPALAATKAGQNQAILRMDGMFLLGFSVRTGQAVTDLTSGLARFGS
jgi:iron complex transport system substrate-binding protein